jgi:hypothetical protein
VFLPCLLLSTCAEWGEPDEVPKVTRSQNKLSAHLIGPCSSAHHTRTSLTLAQS